MRKAENDEIPSVVRAFPANMETLLAGLIKTGTKGFFVLTKSSTDFIITSAAAVPHAERINQKPEAVEPAKAHTAEVKTIAGTKRLLKSHRTAPRLIQTFAVKNKHKRTRQVAVAIG